QDLRIFFVGLREPSVPKELIAGCDGACARRSTCDGQGQGAGSQDGGAERCPGGDPQELTPPDWFRGHLSTSFVQIVDGNGGTKRLMRRRSLDLCHGCWFSRRCSARSPAGRRGQAEVERPCGSCHVGVSPFRPPSRTA